jgi:hypothetical protein
MHRPPLPPGLAWYSFLEAESTQGHMELSDATQGIDPGTFRVVAQCLNHYANLGPPKSLHYSNIYFNSTDKCAQVY